MHAITCVFLDIGGVLLTNGWDHHARKRAATNFELELDEIGGFFYFLLFRPRGRNWLRSDLQNDEKVIHETD